MFIFCYPAVLFQNRYIRAADSKDVPDGLSFSEI